jgi:uncharacterized repeat protein (TIGR01451 family)
MNRSTLAGAAVAGTGLLLALGTVSGAGAPQVCAPPSGGVQVCKTVIVTKLDTWSWTLQKAATSGALQLAAGASAPLGYTISATPTLGTSWYVSGAVIVKNQTQAPVTGVDASDTLKVPGSPDQTVVLATNQTVPVVGGGSNGERHFDYGFVTTSAAPGAVNTGSATWNGGSGTIDAPFSFDNPPNEVAYNRRVTVADTFKSLEGTGLAVGAPSDPGPWTFEADNPATLSKSFSVDVTNQGLAAGQTAAIGNTATLSYITQEPEVVRLDDASVKNIPLGVAVSAAAEASVPVTAVAPPGPPATPATPTTPGSAPLVPLVSGTKTTPKKPKPKAKSVCPAPNLSMLLLGPRQLTAGQRVTYTIRVSNRAKNPSKNTVINYPIPSGFSVVTANGAAAKTIRGASVRLAVGTVPGHGSKTVRVVMRVDSTTAGSKVNRARASSGSCGATAAATVPINVQAIGAAVTPAVTG